MVAHRALQTLAGVKRSDTTDRLTAAAHELKIASNAGGFTARCSSMAVTLSMQHEAHLAHASAGLLDNCRAVQLMPNAPTIELHGLILWP
jgi:hypothetical protein